MSDVRPAERALSKIVLSRVGAANLVPYVSRQLQYVGRTGTAGIGLFVFALAFFFGASFPLKGQLADLQSNVDRAGQSRAEVRGPAQPTVDSFVNELPAQAELPVLTEKIVAAATAAGIALERGTYSVTTTRTGRLVRVQMTFPVHARYPDIRRFVDTTLATLPGAAVDGLRLERKDVTAAEIDADIRFALYLRRSP
jgi:hypothetical protein